MESNRDGQIERGRRINKEFDPFDTRALFGGLVAVTATKEFGNLLRRSVATNYNALLDRVVKKCNKQERTLV